MADDPITNGTPPSQVDPAEVERLRREVADLRAQLAHAREGLRIFQEDVIQLRKGGPHDTPLTPEEIHDMMHGPRGESILDMLAKFERELESEKEGRRG